MTPRNGLPLVTFLALFASFSLCSGHAAGQERRADEELEPLAEALAEYFEARAEGRDREAPRAAVATAMDAVEDAEARHPLARAEDLGRALWLAEHGGRQRVKKGKVVEETYTGGSFAREGLEYAYRLPKDYAPDEQAYPLLVVLPDADEEPAAHVREHWTDRDLRDGAVLVCPEMPALTEEWHQVAVSGRPGGLCYVLTAVRLATERFAVDPDRVFVVGRGKSVPAAVAAGNYSPQRFAGILGRSGDAGDQGPENFRNLPTWFASGGARARAFQEECEKLGFANCTLTPQGTETDLWRWAREQRRAAFPEKLALVVGQPFPTRVHWLRVAPSASDARAEAEVDRAAGTVRVQAHGVSHVTLYLSDALLDLDKPVRVTLNDVTHERHVDRHLATALDLFSAGTSDAGTPYVAELRLEVGAPASDADAGERRLDGAWHERMSRAGEDAGLLWDVYGWAAEKGLQAEAQYTLRRLLRVAPDDLNARAAAGYHGRPGAWFRTAAEWERYRAGQQDDVAEARGRVRHQGLWIQPHERALAGKGLVKDPATGQWLSVAERKKLEDGWVRQDLQWIPPEAATEVDAGRYLVAGEWCELPTANRRRAHIDNMWHIPLPELVLHATTDRAVALRAGETMARALGDLRRVFGAEPPLPLDVLVLRDEEQYDRFAFGDPDGRRLPTHAGRLHVIHSAFFAESWLPLVDGEREYRGMGVCYWDTLQPHGDLYGVHSARLAVGLSYVDALDPSTKAVRKALRTGADAEYLAAFEEEKQLPRWLRYGGPVYAERFFRDETVHEDGDPWWARKWSLENLAQRGGLRPLDELFAFELRPEDRADGLKLLIEAGLCVAFLVDGGVAPAAAALTEFQDALRSGRLHANHVRALEQALRDSEAQLREFARVQ